MTALTLEQMQQDQLVMSIARAVALANDTATARGVDPAKSLVTVSEESSEQGQIWRVQYGPRDYLNRRGGDLIVLVDKGSGTVQKIIRGQ